MIFKRINSEQSLFIVGQSRKILRPFGRDPGEYNLTFVEKSAQGREFKVYKEREGKKKRWKGKKKGKKEKKEKKGKKGQKESKKKKQGEKGSKKTS